MFITIIDQKLCFWVLIRWKWVIFFSVFDTLWNLGLFWFPKTPPLILNFSQLKLGTFLIFLRSPPPLDRFPEFPRFLVWKATLRLSNEHRMNNHKTNKSWEDNDLLLFFHKHWLSDSRTLSTPILVSKVGKLREHGHDEHGNDYETGITNSNEIANAGEGELGLAAPVASLVLVWVTGQGRLETNCTKRRVQKASCCTWKMVSSKEQQLVCFTFVAINPNINKAGIRETKVGV